MADEFIFENDGYCPCCRAATTFRAYNEWLRDFYVCTVCGSIPRQRHLQAVLDERFPNWTELTVHESSPSNNFLARYASDYTASQYFEDVPRGEARGGVRSENLEALTYPDESIDIFITQDVMEHVFHPELAISEIHRVLKPGGAHVFTTPKHRGLGATVQRASISADGVVENILEESWHGNPIGERALVTFDFGYDFEQLLSTWSGVSVEAVHTLDRTRGLDAEFNEVFVIAKPTATGNPPPLSYPRAVAAKLRYDVTRTRNVVSDVGLTEAARRLGARLDRQRRARFGR